MTNFFVDADQNAIVTASGTAVALETLRETLFWLSKPGVAESVAAAESWPPDVKRSGITSEDCGYRSVTTNFSTGLVSDSRDAQPDTKGDQDCTPPLLRTPYANRGGQNSVASNPHAVVLAM